MNRVTFLIDGFNLYHSAIDAEWALNSSTKWLDIKKLCSLYLPEVSRVAKEKTGLAKIYYFSAFAKHIEAYNPDVIARHKDLIKCFEDTGVIVEMSRFKAKKVRCLAQNGCKQKFVKHEEKETDVAIAAKLFEIFITNECDTAVLVTGDTDITPAVKTASRLFPKKTILFAFPFKRKNKELLQLFPGSFKINSRQYTKNQFPDPYQLSDGSLIDKPSSW